LLKTFKSVSCCFFVKITSAAAQPCVAASSVLVSSNEAANVNFKVKNLNRNLKNGIA
jgi:hypothetical protein